MKKMFEQLVQQKINQITSKELIQYGKQYGFNLTKSQADQIVAYIKRTSIDPFNEKDRLRLLKKIAQITDQSTAQKAHKLFKDITKQYGVEGWF